MKLLDEYYKKIKSIYKYFNVPNRHMSYVIEDHRENYWSIDGGVLTYGFTLDEWNDGMYCCDLDLNSDLFIGKEYTMMKLSSDFGNDDYLAIFDNSKQQIIEEDV